MSRAADFKQVNEEIVPLVRKYSYMAEGEIVPKDSCCGLSHCTQRSSEATREFVKVLQDMISKSVKESPGSESIFQRIRVFDDRVIPFGWQQHKDGQEADGTFTACRSSQFRRLRTAAGISEEQYCTSLCTEPLVGKSGQGGKSGALFLRSRDNRYILKSIAEHEFMCLKEILPTYVLYLEERRESLLCRIYGAYTLHVAGVMLHIVVMANVLQGAGENVKVYDLKGTTEDRWVDPAKGSVLKDNNFRNCTMHFEASEAQRLQTYIRDDAEFLESLGLMDYSLLVGISPENGSTASESVNCCYGGHLRTDSQAPTVTPQIFRMGIIDYLQRWTPKKVAAHWLKKCTIGCSHEIDTEPPTVYCKRFSKYLTSNLSKIQAASNIAPGQRGSSLPASLQNEAD